MTPHGEEIKLCGVYEPEWMLIGTFRPQIPRHKANYWTWYMSWQSLNFGRMFKMWQEMNNSTKER